MTDQAAETVKSCCAEVYGSDLVALLLGESYHPGGLPLTRRLAAYLDLAPNVRVLDVASGRGTSALALAAEYGADVEGVDLSAANVAAASSAAAAAAVAGMPGRVRFRVADAERLPFSDASFDAVVCECALCTFPDKPAAAAEFARVLRPGGLLGITDVTADPAALPPRLTSLAATVACVADARPLEDYAAIVTAAGLTVLRTERHDEAAAAMVDRIESRLLFARMTAAAKLREAGYDPEVAATVIAAVREAIAAGRLGYALLVAAKP